MASNTKIQKVAMNDSSDFNIAEVIEQIEEVQNEVDLLNEQASEEILKVEQKYNKLRQPFFDKRSEFISKIPNFWSQAILNHPQLAVMYSEDDIDVLTHLEKVEVKEYENIKSGYKIIFTFSENEYFKNKVLEKEFNTNENGEMETKCTKIEWHNGKCLFKSGDVGKDRKRPAPSSAHLESFFGWFEGCSDMLNDEIGELIKDDIWNNPMQYYLSCDMDDDDEDIDDEEEEEEGDEDEVDDGAE